MPKETNDLEKTIQEFEEVRDELKEILMDIRVFLMEALTPIPNDLERARLREELDADGR
jgi:hypothetical protein